MAKDEEVDRVRRLNWALEERLPGMCAEAQAWRDLALSHEAAATALRADLDHALQARRETHARLDDDDPGDAESCCYDDKVEEDAEATSGGRCQGCGERASVVLVLPCRHLCACAVWPCGRAPRAAEPRVAPSLSIWTGRILGCCCWF